jgi:hypothetical protein
MAQKAGKKGSGRLQTQYSKCGRGIPHSKGGRKKKLPSVKNQIRGVERLLRKVLAGHDYKLVFLSWTFGN